MLATRDITVSVACSLVLAEALGSRENEKMPRITKTSSPGENATAKSDASDRLNAVDEIPTAAAPVTTTSPGPPNRGAGGSIAAGRLVATGKGGAVGAACSSAGDKYRQSSFLGRGVSPDAARPESIVGDWACVSRVSASTHEVTRAARTTPHRRLEERRRQSAPIAIHTFIAG